MIVFILLYQASLENVSSFRIFYSVCNLLRQVGRGLLGRNKAKQQKSAD